MALSTGMRIGPYEVAEPIGAGGMGEVYRATDTKLKRDVAVKVLPESFATDADRVARFQREAEVLASLNHSNIAQIYGLEDAGGATALVMELVEGPTLADRIAEGPIPPDQALNIAMQIADALEAAHGKQIVHRDLKPANIKLRPDGTIKVLDFGIAKAVDAQAISGGRTPAHTTPAVTETGVIMGTAAYMAPEQARGLPVDERADIWAFGCLLYEMLTGQAAFGGEDIMATLARVIDRDADLSSIPGTLSPAVRHTIKLCLEKNVKKRVADIRDVRLALEGAFESWPRASEAPGGSARASRGALIGVGLGGLVVGLLGAGAVVLLGRPPESLPPELPPLTPAPVSRYLVTPPATAPLANLGGFDVAISEDGSTLAYFAEDPESGQFDLYVRDLDDLEPRLLPGTRVNQGNGNMNPFFSADGSWIGYLAPGEGIIRISVNGGPPIKIAEGADNFLGGTTTADGTLIYSTGEALYRVSATGGGTPERLTGEFNPAQNGPYISPQLLPGGEAVLYARGNDNVAVLNLTTGEEKVLVEGGQNPRYTTSGHVAFARGTTLMAVPFDPEELAVTGEPVVVQQGIRQPGANAAADFSVSASGTLVYVPATEGETAASRLVWVDREGQVIENALDRPIVTPLDPRLSPDGRKLALRHGVTPLTSGTSVSGAGSLWIYDLSGRPPIPLADIGLNTTPTWSPDGTQIAFVSNRGGAFEIYIAPADGSLLSPEPLLSLQPPVAPGSWSSDGELILWRPAGPTSNADILVTSLNNIDDVRDLVVTENNEYDPALSPSGRWLAYVSDRTGGPEIWAMRYPGGVPVRVSANGGFEPRWAADETELYYLQGNAMMAVPIDMDTDFPFGAEQQLFVAPFFNSSGVFNTSYDVAADGRFLMIERPGSSREGADPSSFVVVENWITELERVAPRD